jgi:hypothetical protein
MPNPRAMPRSHALPDFHDRKDEAAARPCDMGTENISRPGLDQIHFGGGDESRTASSPDFARRPRIGRHGAIMIGVSRDKHGHDPRERPLRCSARARGARLRCWRLRAPPDFTNRSHIALRSTQQLRRPKRRPSWRRSARPFAWSRLKGDTQTLFPVISIVTAADLGIMILINGFCGTEPSS